MSQVVLIDGREKTQVSVFNRNMQFGDGLFETCIGHDSKILFWQQHFDRLNVGCEKLSIKKIDESFITSSAGLCRIYKSTAVLIKLLKVDMHIVVFSLNCISYIDWWQNNSSEPATVTFICNAFF